MVFRQGNPRLKIGQFYRCPRGGFRSSWGEPTAPATEIAHYARADILWYDKTMPIFSENLHASVRDRVELGLTPCLRNPGSAAGVVGAGLLAA